LYVVFEIIMTEKVVLAALENDDDLLLLSSLKEEKVLAYQKLDIDNLTNDQCRTMFRFGREDINILSNALRLPETIICTNRTVASDDLSRDWLSYEHLRSYAEAVSDRNAPLENCWGFIDGTVRPICRPQQNQKLVFNGHKRLHGLKFQNIVIPNGLISHLYGPIEGRHHDAGMLRESNVLAQMANHMTSPNGHIFSVYGDPAYPLGDGYIIPPYRGGAISRNQMIFNKRMSAVRICVEWAFGKVLSLFAYLDFKKKSKGLPTTCRKILCSCCFTH
jgi:hypothetical protein